MDGTIVPANASKHAAVSHQRAGELIAQFELEMQEQVTHAEAADASAPKEALDVSRRNSNAADNAWTR